MAGRSPPRVAFSSSHASLACLKLVWLRRCLLGSFRSMESWQAATDCDPTLAARSKHVLHTLHREVLVHSASREYERAGAVPLAKRQVRALKQLLAGGPSGMDALEPDLLTDLRSGLLQIQVQSTYS